MYKVPQIDWSSIKLKESVKSRVVRFHSPGTMNKDYIIAKRIEDGTLVAFHKNYGNKIYPTNSRRMSLFSKDEIQELYKDEGKNWRKEHKGFFVLKKTSKKFKKNYIIEEKPNRIGDKMGLYIRDRLDKEQRMLLNKAKKSIVKVKGY